MKVAAFLSIILTALVGYSCSSSGTESFTSLKESFAAEQGVAPEEGVFLLEGGVSPKTLGTDKPLTGEDSDLVNAISGYMYETHWLSGFPWQADNSRWLNTYGDEFYDCYASQIVRELGGAEESESRYGIKVETVVAQPAQQTDAQEAEDKNSKAQTSILEDIGSDLRFSLAHSRGLVRAMYDCSGSTELIERSFNSFNDIIVNRKCDSTRLWIAMQVSGFSGVSVSDVESVEFGKRMILCTEIEKNLQAQIKIGFPWINSECFESSPSYQTILTQFEDEFDGYTKRIKRDGDGSLSGSKGFGTEIDDQETYRELVSCVNYEALYRILRVERDVVSEEIIERCLLEGIVRDDELTESQDLEEFSGSFYYLDEFTKELSSCVNHFVDQDAVPDSRN